MQLDEADALMEDLNRSVGMLGMQQAPTSASSAAPATALAVQDPLAHMTLAQRGARAAQKARERFRKKSPRPTAKLSDNELRHRIQAKAHLVYQLGVGPDAK